MASSSLSHQQNAFSGIEPSNRRRKVEESSRLFDVFINHRGPDVKQTLATQLYNSLKARGIRAFLDSEEKEHGVLFTSSIESAIKSASVQIAIFSPGYVRSPYCLAELVLMLQSEAKIIPLFYQVKPSDLRYIEKGVYANAFLEYEDKNRYMEKLPEWKKALQTVSFTTGYEFENSDSSDCKDIVSVVEKEVQRTKRLHVAKHPVGLHKLVKDLEKQCLRDLVEDFESQCGMNRAGKKKANAVGIFGMGGVGKTTLSKELFNQKRSKYKRASFLFDVREACASGKLPSLQSKLLEDLFCEDHHRFLSSEEGASCLRDRLERSSSSSFLIVLDDLDHMEQLEALFIKDILNKSDNNLVIITTRDFGVLVSAGIDIGYHLKGLDREDGRELFCWHAFNQPLPLSGYDDLVQAFVNMCGGLPLSIIVLGRHVFGRAQWYWQDELEKIKETLPGDIKRRLKISFDTLDNVEKQIFMDIACFFIEKPITTAMTVWKGSGWRAPHAFETLKEKCLVEEVEVRFLNRIEHKWESRSDWPALRMHDHLRDLGREMANELSHPRRVWHPQHLRSLELKGFRNILEKTKGRCFHSILERSMDCKITYFLGDPEDGSDTSLLWLQLEYLSCRPLGLNSDMNSNIPSWIPLQYLQCLRIGNGCFQKLWQSNVQAPSHLKELQIRECPKLKELRLAHLRSLEEITIENCYHLKSVSGISNLAKLVELKISGCKKLDFEYSGLSGMKCLERITLDRYLKTKYFELDGCQNLKTIKFGYEKLVEVSIRDCPELEELPDLIGPSCLERIIIDGCGNLKYLKLNGFENLKSVSGNFELTQLYITKCPELEDLPSLSRLSCLEQIYIDSCKKLQNLMLPTTLIRLSVLRCRDLQGVAGTGDLTKLTQLYIAECPELEELPSLSRLSCLEQIYIYSCEKLQNLRLPTTLIRLSVLRCGDLQRTAGTGDLTKLTQLYIKECPVLEESPILSRLSCLEEIDIDSCEKLQNLTLPTTLIRLSVRRCRDLQRVVGTHDLTKLTQLYIKECPKLEELPSLSRLWCLKEMEIEFCEKLQNLTLPTPLIRLSVGRCRDLQRVAGTGDLTNLTQLDIAECPELEELPSLSRLSCLKQIYIYSCEKLQNLNLPTTLIRLSLLRCRDLQRAAGTGDLTKLTQMYIKECPALEELPVFSRLSCLEEIDIDSCEKLQNLTLPTTFIRLSVGRCRDLQRVAGTGDLTKLTYLYIKKCPKLEELPRLSRLSCLKEIKIESCEKLQNISGNEELLALQRMRLIYCSNAVIRNCIDKLKVMISILF